MATYFFSHETTGCPSVPQTHDFRLVGDRRMLNGLTFAEIVDGTVGATSAGELPYAMRPLLLTPANTTTGCLAIFNEVGSGKSIVVNDLVWTFAHRMPQTTYVIGSLYLGANIDTDQTAGQLRSALSLALTTETLGGLEVVPQKMDSTQPDLPSSVRVTRQSESPTTFTLHTSSIGFLHRDRVATSGQIAGPSGGFRGAGGVRGPLGDLLLQRGSVTQPITLRAGETVVLSCALIDSTLSALPIEVMVFLMIEVDGYTYYASTVVHDLVNAGMVSVVNDTGSGKTVTVRQLVVDYTHGSDLRPSTTVFTSPNRTPSHVYMDWEPVDSADDGDALPLVSTGEALPAGIRVVKNAIVYPSVYRKAAECGALALRNYPDRRFRVGLAGMCTLPERPLPTLESTMGFRNHPGRGSTALTLLPGEGIALIKRVPWSTRSFWVSGTLSVTDYTAPATGGPSPTARAYA